MGGPEERFEEIAGADAAERPELVEKLVADYREIGECTHFDLKEVQWPPGRDAKGDLAQEVSGFANEAGGLIIWGFEDFGKGGGPKPLEDAEEFKTWLDRMAPECTAPTAPDVRSVAAPLGNGKGYAVTFVGRSDRGPHRANIGPSKVKDHYFRRRSERSTKMSHAELEDMFGRRPRPLVLPEVVLHRSDHSRSMLFRLQNIGLGTARWSALRLSVSPCEPEHSTMRPHPNEPSFGQADVRTTGGERTAVFVPNIEVLGFMHPGMGYEYCRVAIGVSNRRYVPGQVVYRWSTMAENMRNHRGELVLAAEQILGNGPQFEVIARWEPHPDWGRPLFTIPLADG